MPNGILIIDKPQGWTSMDVCAKLRGILHERRIGHGGTLDPMATGVLPVFVGSATKAVEFAEGGQKEYIAALQLGLVTNTDDTTGEVLRRQSVSVSAEALQGILPAFTGELQQIPPMFSAIKIGGKKLYELARAGKEVERRPRSVTIYEIELLQQLSPDSFSLRILCSKGTYIRSLCRDMGEALGCGGCMSALRRTMAAGFTLKEAVTLEQVEAGAFSLLPTDALFAADPAYTLSTQRQERLCRNGNPVPAAGLAPGRYRLYSGEGEFLCLSRWEDGELRSIKNFFGS